MERKARAKAISWVQGNLWMMSQDALSLSLSLDLSSIPLPLSLPQHPSSSTVLINCPQKDDPSSQGPMDVGEAEPRRTRLSSSLAHHSVVPH